MLELLGVGPLHFRESTNPITQRNALFVPGLKKNLISVSMIEDMELGVSLVDGHMRVFPKTVGLSAS